MFFFEKKNQKTFVCFGCPEFTCLGSEPRAICKSFLLLFFKKEAFLSLFPALLAEQKLFCVRVNKTHAGLVCAASLPLAGVLPCSATDRPPTRMTFSPWTGEVF
jgi:hypothetical protein